MEGDWLAPFVPTPPEIVDRMLEFAGLGPNDVLYDLGCGDGRIVVAASAGVEGPYI
jgi:cyclopropane fatty-acyl-phospholipid synthase-like methyltransferase